MYKNKAVFFDFDYTLTNFDSFKSFLIFYYSKNFIKFLIYFPFLFFAFVFRKLKIINLKTAKELLLIGLKGKSRTSIHKLGQDFINIKFEKLFNKKALQTIQNFRQTGYLIFLVTSAPNIYFEHVKNRFGFNEVCCCEMIYKNNVFTGKISSHTCFGMEKKKYILLVSKQHSIDLSKSYAYTDNISDLPMLEVVGNPVVVNVNNELIKLAQQRKYDIVYWFNV